MSFHQLMSGEWKDVICNLALKSLATGKHNKIDLVPLTDDLRLLNTFLRKEVVDCMAIHSAGDLKTMTVKERRVWHHRLSRVVLAWVTIFNKSRGNEVAAMRLTSYQRRPDWQEIQRSLSITEEKMSERFV